jgi:hypothetical protein
LVADEPVHHIAVPRRVFDVVAARADLPAGRLLEGGIPPSHPIG